MKSIICYSQLSILLICCGSIPESIAPSGTRESIDMTNKLTEMSIMTSLWQSSMSPQLCKQLVTLTSTLFPDRANLTLTERATD